MASGGAAVALAAMTSGIDVVSVWAIDIGKVEIIRDFFQFLGIYFSSLNLPNGFKYVKKNFHTHLCTSLKYFFF